MSARRRARFAACKARLDLDGRATSADDSGGRYLLRTDIPNNHILKWEEETGAVSIFRRPANYADGLTRDRQGRLIAAEHGRRFTRTGHDGNVTVLIDSFDGQKPNSPNDVAVASDGAIWSS